MSVFTQTLHQEHDVTQGQVLQNRVKPVWIHSFPSSCLIALPRIKKNSVYLTPITEGRTVDSKTPPTVLASCETQTASFRVWNWVCNSISYDCKHYSMLCFVLFCTRSDRILHTVYLIFYRVVSKFAHGPIEICIRSDRIFLHGPIEFCTRSYRILHTVLSNFAHGPI